LTALRWGIWVGCGPAGRARPPAGGGGESLLDPSTAWSPSRTRSLAGRADAAPAGV